MNWEDSSGSSSCNGQENGDGFNGSERPLKKARYAWQVKGKYHLKNKNNDPAKITTTESTDPGMAGSSSSGNNSSNSNNIGTEQDIKTIDGCILNKNLDTLDSVVDEPDKSDLKPSKRKVSLTDSSTSNLFTPIESVEEMINNNCARDFTCEEFRQPKVKKLEPLTNKNEEDECIESWQIRQMMEVQFENAINQVTDYIKQNPLEELAATAAFEVADFLNNLPRINRVENEGILMAISEHGLQNTSNSYFDYIERQDWPPFYSRPSLYSQQWYIDEMKTEDNEPIMPPTLYGTALHVNNVLQNLHGPDEESDDLTLGSASHHDFLEAAVLFTVNNNGLTAFGKGYG